MRAWHPAARTSTWHPAAASLPMCNPHAPGHLLSPRHLLCAARGAPKAGGGRRGARGSAAAADGDAPAGQGKENENPVENGEAGVTESGRRKRKDAGQQREKSSAWTEEEEVKFNEALELHGRCWAKAGEHIGTRDARQVSNGDVL